MRNLYTEFPWLPDGAAIEGECLAREGNHQDSLKAFLAVAERGLPLFTDGLSYTIDRLQLYVRNQSHSEPEKLARACTTTVVEQLL